MKISARGKYAVRIMVDMANHDADFVSLNDIAIRQKISLKYLEKIIASLVRGKLLISKRGQNGGYKLLKTPPEYTLYEIFKLTNDTPKIAACTYRECKRQNTCETVQAWASLSNLINDFLKTTTLQDIINKKV